MKCCCPECGHVAGMAAFAGEADARECMALALAWPAPMADALMRYLQLFRPPRRALAWSRALRLMRLLHQDMERGYITRHGRDWAAPHELWQSALQTVYSRRDELTLPLKDHAYLYEIITRGVNKTEAKAEAERESKRRKRPDRSRPAAAHDDPEPQRTLPPGGSLKALLKEQAAARRASTTANSNDG